MWYVSQEYKLGAMYSHDAVWAMWAESYNMTVCKENLAHSQIEPVEI